MGEISDLVVNGDVCQFCLEEMGEGDGYPRTCAGCSEDSDHLSSGKQFKIKAFDDVLKKNNVNVTKFSEYHWRLPDYHLDLWPTTGKYKKTGGGRARKITPTQLDDITSVKPLTEKLRDSIKEEVIRKLNAMADGDDNERAHEFADKLLLNLLTGLGHEDVVLAYEKARERVRFYYA